MFVWVYTCQKTKLLEITYRSAVVSGHASLVVHEVKDLN